MTEKHALSPWNSWCAIIAGITLFSPVIIYSYFLPKAGSSAVHALTPESFLPWMMEHGELREALWWLATFSFCTALISIPGALHEKLRHAAPSASKSAKLSGIMGLFILMIACIILVAGERLLAVDYVSSDEQLRPAIITLYHWQRHVTAMLFDFLGFFLLGLWITSVNVIGLHSKTFPKGLGVFGVITGLLCLSFAVGYITGIGWMGELGIGVLSFFAMPAWFIWVGVFQLPGRGRWG